MEKDPLFKKEIEKLMSIIIDQIAFIKKLRDVLKNYKDEERQQKYKIYIPNIGEHYGVPIPILNIISKEIGKWGQKNPTIVLSLLQLMWQGSHEEKFIVTKSLEKIGKADFENSLKFIESIIDDITTWDICDTLASSGMKNIITSKPDEILPLCEKWINNEKKWIRRFGVVSLIPLIRIFPKEYQIGDQELKIVEKLMNDEEMDVKKGVAWILREISKKDQKLIYDFLLNHATTKNKSTKWIINNAMRKLSENLQNEISVILNKK